MSNFRTLAINVLADLMLFYTIRDVGFRNLLVNNVIVSLSFP